MEAKQIPVRIRFILIALFVVLLLQLVFPSQEEKPFSSKPRITSTAQSVFATSASPVSPNVSFISSLSSLPTALAASEFCWVGARSLSASQLSRLLALLWADSNLTAVSLRSLDRRSFALAANGNFSWSAAVIELPTQSVATIDGIACISADLLSDSFLIRSSLLLNHNETLSWLNRTGNFYLSWLLKGSVKECWFQSEATLPTLTINPMIANLTSLIPFDVHFHRLPELLGLWHLSFRPLAGPQIDFWMGCSWASEALDTQLHCRQWTRQNLVDAVRVVEKGFRLDYRVHYGTALGADRDKDVIPWTRDVDIVPLGHGEGFRERWIADLEQVSGGLFVPRDMLGWIAGDIERAFRNYPYRFTHNGTSGPVDMARVDRMVRKAQQDASICTSFRSRRNLGEFGIFNHTYVDIYREEVIVKMLPSHMKEGRIAMAEECGKVVLRSPPTLVTINGAEYKAVGALEAHLRCQYGQQRPPSSASWTGC